MGFGSLGFWEILVILVIVLVVFGPQRLPEMARSAGRVLRDFKRGLNEIQRELEEAEGTGDEEESESGGARPAGPVRPGTDRPDTGLPPGGEAGARETEEGPAPGPDAADGADRRSPSGDGEVDPPAEE